MKVCVDAPDDFLALVPGVFRAGQIHDTVGWPAQPKPAPLAHDGIGGNPRGSPCPVHGQKRRLIGFQLIKHGGRTIAQSWTKYDTISL